MRAVDDAILAVMRSTGIEIHDGQVHVEVADTVSYDLPYAYYESNIGDDHSPRMTGGTTRRSMLFTVGFVGLTREQAKAAGERLRDVLEGRRFNISGRRSWLCSLDVSTRIFRDDDAIRPDGKPLWMGVDRYVLSVTKSPQRPA